MCCGATAPARSWPCRPTTSAISSSPSSSACRSSPSSIRAISDVGRSRRRFWPASSASAEDGVSINSGRYNGLTTADFKRRITADLATAGLGREAVNYKLRDWLFSRQRFWGEPFPILHELDDNGQPTGMIRAVDAKDLPVDLPHLDDYKPPTRRAPEPPLAKRRRSGWSR